MQKAFAALAALGTLILICQARQASDHPANPGESVPGQLLVQFKAGVAQVDKSRVLARVDAAFLRGVAPQSRR